MVSGGCKSCVCDLCPASVSVHSHNEFLLAILTRCQILVSAPGKGAACWQGLRQQSLEALGFGFL